MTTMTTMKSVKFVEYPTSDDVYMHLRNRNVFIDDEYSETYLHLRNRDIKMNCDDLDTTRPIGPKSHDKMQGDVDEVYMHLRNRDVWNHLHDNSDIEMEDDDIYMHLRNRDVYEMHEVVKFVKSQCNEKKERRYSSPLDFYDLRDKQILKTL